MDRDRRAASNFADAAAAAGVERVVYLGGIEPESGAVSPHLRSRLEVERILREAGPRSRRLGLIAGAVNFPILLVSARHHFKWAREQAELEPERWSPALRP